VTIAYRPAELADAQFIVSTWSRAYKRSKQAGIIATEDWERVMHPQIQRLLARPTTTTIVAYENTDPDFLYGHIAGDLTGNMLFDDERGEWVFDPSPLIYFCYVKESFRRAGYARGLFAQLGVDPRRRFLFTCWTPVVAKIASEIPLAKHIANLARYPKSTKEQ
jgi:hypothetical protein